MTSPASRLAIIDAALHHLMEQTFDGRKIAKIVRSPWASYSSFAMELLEFRFTNGDECTFVAKDVGPRGRLEIGAKLKPAFLFNPIREIWMYQHVLCQKGIDAAGFYGIAVDADRGHRILLLEYIKGSPLWQFDDLVAWKAAARWLGQFHQRAGSPATSESLIRFDADWYSTWPRRAIEFHRANPDRSAFLEKLADRYQDVIEQLLKLPAQLIHGEFVPSNVLVEQAEQSFKIRVIDWEMAALGPPLMDLADLIAGKWDESARDQIIGAYRNTLPANSQIADDDDFARHLNLCRLHKAVQWLGWSPGWKAPQEHSTDWFAETQRLARLLQLV